MLRPVPVPLYLQQRGVPQGVTFVSWQDTTTPAAKRGHQMIWSRSICSMN